MAPQLPLSTSPTLALDHPTQAEKLATLLLNSVPRRGQLSLPAYLRREAHLENQALTRDGGITFWVLVDTSTPSDEPRRILSSCETLRKRTLVKRGDGAVEEGVGHGVASVFTPPEFRGRGYSSRMMQELGPSLDTWMQRDGNKTEFTVLFSDIGKQFYAKAGWKAFPSSHIALPPITEAESSATDHKLSKTGALSAVDLSEICKLDEATLRRQFEKTRSNPSRVLVALIPDVEVLQWHHAREEFVADELLRKIADVKGASAVTQDGKKAFCIWTRTFGGGEHGNVLHILRIFIDKEEFFTPREEGAQDDGVFVDGSNEQTILALASLLRAAQLEAGRWDMDHVELWNPAPLSIAAARVLDHTAQVVDRESEAITSLRWHGPEQRGIDVEWVANEKYGWH